MAAWFFDEALQPANEGYASTAVMSRNRPLIISLLAAIAVFGFGMAYAVVTYRHGKMAILGDRNLIPAFDSAEGSRPAAARVYLVGDSQISHWPLDCHGDWNLYRSGFPGEATVNIASATHALFEDIKPDVVMVISGGNDVSAASLIPASERNAAVESSLAAFRQIIENSTSAGARRIFVFSIEPSRYSLLAQWILWAHDLDAIRGKLNEGLAQMCRENCQVLPLAAVLEIKSESEWRNYLSDGVHLNRKAYERLSLFIETETHSNQL